MVPSEPPSRPSLPSASGLDRRSLLKGGAVGGILSAGLPSAPSLAAQSARGFTHGVASGEPGPDRVLLWTRYVAAQDTALAVEVSRTLDFFSHTRGDTATARPENDFCAKVVIDGLEPDTWYYYRFVAPDGTVSEKGRTRTLPAGPTARFRMAVFSCSNIGFGWFNAYAHAAEANDFDLLVHTGDYFYEYEAGRYPDDPMTRRRFAPVGETVALADYRLRHASYRADPDLRRMTQLYPMIMGWDDHESANDSYADGAENHQPDTEGDWAVRKAAAMRAYREWLPVSDNPYEAYEVGDLATLFRLETRLTARSRPPSLREIMAGGTSPDDMVARLSAFRDGAYRDPARTMLGTGQEEWLASGLARSARSGKTWQVLAQQVVMGSLSTPPALAGGVTEDMPDFIRQRVMAAALASRAGLPMNMDAWDGYPAARERLLASALEAGANLLVLAGDSHNAWAFELDHGGERAGVEFAGQSVTSPGFEGYLANVPPQVLEGAVTAHNAQLKWADTSQRGYMAIELTPQRAVAEYRFLGSIAQKSTALAATKRLQTRPGEHLLEDA
ncbi:alkaline phosphatase D family protein [Altererythrobacter sp. MTPC7]|uniref:alkaline phosphatase D family protein n=1 Tax=Altererythrobacter sp. MTPC7 TaxID=3056567 RepID=UPI0036F415C3